MNSSNTKKLLLGSILVLTILLVGSIVAYGHGGDEQGSNYQDGEEVTLTGILTTFEDHGFILSTVEGDVFVPIPNIDNQEDFNLEINGDVTVTGYFMTHSMMVFLSEQMFHPNSINGVEIQHDQGEGCKGSRMGGHMGMNP